MKAFLECNKALDAMSVHAPRAWCRRLLLALITDGTLKAYAFEGQLTGTLPILALLDDDSPLVPADGDSFWKAVDQKWPLRRLGPDFADERGRYAITGFRWTRDYQYGPNLLAPGYFMHADVVDLEAGRVTFECLEPYDLDAVAFGEDAEIFKATGEMSEAQASWLEFRGAIGEIAFEAGAIDLLTGLERLGAPKARPTGRPAKWDWIGAMTAVVALANSADGITLEHGEQAKVERALADWFVRHTGDQPNVSQIRSCAQRVMDALAQK